MGKTQPNEKAHGFVLSARAGGLLCLRKEEGAFWAVKKGRYHFCAGYAIIKRKQEDGEGPTWSESAFVHTVCRSWKRGGHSAPTAAGSLQGATRRAVSPAGTVLAGRYTVGDIKSVDGEGILYRGVENTGPFRVTIKEYMPLTLAAERGKDCILRPKPGSEVLFKTTRMDFADLYRFIQRITPANGLEAVLDVFEENNTVYAVMENPGGCPLQKWLEEHGTVTPQQACAMLEPVFRGWRPCIRWGLCTGASARPTSAFWTMAAPG